MSGLSDSQREDVRDLLNACRQFDAEAVIIGATAYRLLIEDLDRHTLDIDVALALDLDDFTRLESVLAEKGWRQSPKTRTALDYISREPVRSDPGRTQLKDS